MPDDDQRLNAEKTKPVRGRPFVKGNPGGPGRPKRTTEQTYLDVTLARVTPAKWDAIVKKALQQALKGDHRARDWLTKILIGSDPLPLAQLAEQLRAELERLTPCVITQPPLNGKPLTGPGPIYPDAE
jgi:hypothetical protein